MDAACGAAAEAIQPGCAFELELYPPCMLCSVCGMACLRLAWASGSPAQLPRMRPDHTTCPPALQRAFKAAGIVAGNWITPEAIVSAFRAAYGKNVHVVCDKA